MKENQIKVEQLPVISHKAVEVGKAITERIDNLKLDKIVATESNVKALKVLRAELSTELTEFETERKSVKKAIAAPYLEFEEIYKREISEKYTAGISTLKDKILFVENNIKLEKKAEIETYFTEMCDSQNIDFLKFENVGLKIDLTTTAKKLKEQCNAFVLKVADDLLLIETQEFETEIIVEYKKDLNVSKAIKTIADDKAAIKLEKEKKKIIEWNRRRSSFRDIAMILHEDTNTFQYNDEIYIGSEAVKDIDKDSFNKIIIEYTEKIKAFVEAQKKPEIKTETPISTPAPTPPAAKPISKPLASPVKETKLELVKARFECEATLPVLKALGQYMKDNNITYKNLK